nr:hypothetical protein [Pseudomonas luteola]
MKKLCSLISLTLIALLLIIASLRVNALRFEPWFGFGPREVAHLIGYPGVVIGLWLLLICFSHVQAACTHLLLMLGKRLDVYLLQADIIDSMIRTGSVSIKSILHFVAIASLVMSIGFECIWQPCISVYGAPGRGFIQFPQVLCDAVGISLAVAIVWLMAGKKLMNMNANIWIAFPNRSQPLSHLDN